MYSNASWQLIEEHICDDWDDEEEEGETNRIGQLFWGLRYIDDLVFRREDRNLTNEPYPAEDPAEPDWEETETPSWYALSDVQFSLVALITPTARVAERVVYDPYGRARHYFPADYNGDGVVTTPDIIAHLSDWYTHLSADWTRDNDTDVPDIFAFQADWFAYSTKNAGAGQISWRYDPNDGTTANAPDNPIGYCGYVFNPETDDYTVRFRHYDPEIGRWLERDRIQPVLSPNLTTYATNQPTILSDWNGLQATPSGQSVLDAYECIFGVLAIPNQPNRLGIFRYVLAISRMTLSPSDSEGFARFLNTQDCIIREIGECAKCPDGSTDRTELKWIEDVVRDFMRPLIDSLLERGAGASISQPGWRMFFARHDSGSLAGCGWMWSIAKNGAAWCDNNLNPMGTMVWYLSGCRYPKTAYEIENFFAEDSHAIAYYMALNHINVDLRISLVRNGTGKQSTWDCIGRVVSRCQREHQNMVENVGAWIGRSCCPAIDVERMRDTMRDDIIRNRR
jgi:RHS repeat-associated protein